MKQYYRNTSNWNDPPLLDEVVDEGDYWVTYDFPMKIVLTELKSEAKHGDQTNLWRNVSFWRIFGKSRESLRQILFTDPWMCPNALLTIAMVFSGYTRVWWVFADLEEHTRQPGLHRILAPSILALRHMTLCQSVTRPRSEIKIEEKNIEIHRKSLKKSILWKSSNTLNMGL